MFLLRIKAVKRNLKHRLTRNSLPVNWAFLEVEGFLSKPTQHVSSIMDKRHGRKTYVRLIRMVYLEGSGCF